MRAQPYTTPNRCSNLRQVTTWCRLRPEMARLWQHFRLYGLLLALLSDQRLVNVRDHTCTETKITFMNIFLSFPHSQHCTSFRLLFIQVNQVYTFHSEYSTTGVGFISKLLYKLHILIFYTTSLVKPNKHNIKVNGCFNLHTKEMRWIK